LKIRLQIAKLGGEESATLEGKPRLAFVDDWPAHPKQHTGSELKPKQLHESQHTSTTRLVVAEHGGCEADFGHVTHHWGLEAARSPRADPTRAARRDKTQATA
jgi:hypothetical protein